MQRNSGFTLIELIVVIVILGILAAFAVPRFVGMQDEARTATMKGLKGSLQGAASLGHGKALANSTYNPGDSLPVPSVSGDVQMRGTWPEASMDGIGKMIQDLDGFDNSGCNELDNWEACIRFFPSQIANNSTCYVEYAVNSTDEYIMRVTNSSSWDCG